MSAIGTKHPLEEDSSWNAHISRRQQPDGKNNEQDDVALTSSSAAYLPAQADQHLRRLSKARKADEDDDFDPMQLEQLKFEEDMRLELLQQETDDKKQRKAAKKRKKKYKELYQNSGVAQRSVHGLMVSCGTNVVLVLLCI